jgi:hypothetical protein
VDSLKVLDPERPIRAVHGLTESVGIPLHRGL